MANDRDCHGGVGRHLAIHGHQGRDKRRSILPDTLSLEGCEAGKKRFPMSKLQAPKRAWWLGENRQEQYDPLALLGCRRPGVLFLTFPFFAEGISAFSEVGLISGGVDERI